MKTLIVCADDYAMSEPVSQAIELLATTHKISATSVMTLSPMWPIHSHRLLPVKNQIDVGLHLDWTSEFAVQNHFGTSLNRLMLNCLLKPIKVSTAEKIIHHQLDLFESYWGDVPDHIDGHQHIHQFAGIREALIKVIQERYINNSQFTSFKIPYLRISKALELQNNFKAQIISFMGAQKLISLAQKNNISYANFLTGIYDLRVGAISYQSRMQKWLDQTQDNGILMCHPSAYLDKNDVISEARLKEFEYFSSINFLKDTTFYNIKLKYKV